VNRCAEYVRLSAALSTGQQRHDGEGRRRRQAQPVGCAGSGGMAASGTTAELDLTRVSFAHGRQPPRL